ncbi:MAG: stage II sporulation protein M [Desulfurococcales archaeon]|nr:stage II sporulation protein M [Desulfurococcales archaeon]
MEEIIDRRTVITAVTLIVILTVSSLIGYLYADRIIESPAGDIIKGQVKGLKKAGESISIAPIVIFLNNLQVSLMVALLYPTYIIPLAVLVLNGLIIGLLPRGILDIQSIGVLSGLSPGDRAFLYYGMLAPHGILEIPTIALVASLIATGFRRGILKRIARRLLMAAINLAVAAIVETTLSVLVGVVLIIILKAV